ncbi:MAG TPA: multicopper oxidase domain-containing protein [Gaiellaceae bacterium]|nr:multicopper oxidase domain-containing protein [Gaiellaceae bacterium]
MSKRVTRRTLLAGAAIPVAAVPLARLAGAGESDAGASTSSHIGHDHARVGHAAMIGRSVPAPGGPNDLDALLYPPPALPHKPGRVRKYELVAQDREIEVAQGVTYPAWTYNGTVPGPVIRATEGDILHVEFTNQGSHPHTIHFHGIHPGNMDGVFEIIPPGRSFTYEFEAHPYGMHLYHCHATPLKKHIEKGLYGAFIIDPPDLRPPARELVMVMNGFDTDFDGENNFYTVNGLAFYFAKYPIRVKRGELVRIYLANLTEFDLVNSLHIHANFFRYYPTGSSDHFEYTDTVMLCQGQRGILELEFPNPGTFMFHAHQSEFAELGWMGFFEVEE